MKEYASANVIRILVKQFLTELSDLPQEITIAGRAAKRYIGEASSTLQNHIIPSLAHARFKRTYIC